MAARAAVASALRGTRGRGAAALSSSEPSLRYLGTATSKASRPAHHVLSSSSNMSFPPSSSSSRAFLSTQPRMAGEPPAEDVVNDEPTPSEDVVNDEPTPSGKAPSVLTTLPPDYTPGQALGVLQTHSAGGKFVRLTDFRDLALSARPGHKRDAKVILTALKDFKRCNVFSVDTRGSRVAMEAMLRSMTPAPGPESKYVTTAVDKVNASLFVLDAFVDEKTGLYYAAKTEYVEINLKFLLEAVKEAKLKLPGSEAEAEAEEEGHEGDDEDGNESGDAAASDTELAKHVLHTTRDAMAALVKRGFPPNIHRRHMKKRAARKYLKQLRVDEGPAPSTAHVGVEICLELGASAKVTREMVLTPYKAGRYKADQETELLVAIKKKAEKGAIKAAKKKKEEEAKKAAEIATAEAAAAAAAAAAIATAEAAAAAAAAAAQEAEEAEQESSSEDDDTSGGDEDNSGDDTDAKKEQ